MRFGAVAHLRGNTAYDGTMLLVAGVVEIKCRNSAILQILRLRVGSNVFLVRFFRVKDC